MKTFKIAHLYYDLMNLYGENGNLRYFLKKLEEQDIKVELHFLTVGDKIVFLKYDFYYMGMGSEENQLIVLEDFLQYKEDIEKAIANKKFFLMTGNALELFGKRIEYLDGSFKEALMLFDFKCRENKERIVGEQFFETDLIDEKIIGFQNRMCLMSENTYPLFKTIAGSSYNLVDDTEGIHKDNFFATYLLGPLLVRNPYLTEYFVKEICNQLDIKYKKTNRKTLDYKAYQEYLKNFH